MLSFSPRVAPPLVFRLLVLWALSCAIPVTAQVPAGSYSLARRKASGTGYEEKSLSATASSVVTLDASGDPLAKVISDFVLDSELASWAGSPGITTLGTVTTGTWNAGTIAVLRGGTGQTSYLDGQLLIGNTATGGLSKATLTAGSNISITHGNGSITIAASGGSGSGTLTTLKSSGTQVGGADIVTLDFGLGFSLTESPDTEVNIALDATLAALAGATTGANTMTYWTGTDTVGNTALTAYARTLLDDPDLAAAWATLQLNTGTQIAFFSAVSVLGNLHLGEDFAPGALGLHSGVGGSTYHETTSAATAPRTAVFPDKSGQVALVSDPSGRVNLDPAYNEVTGVLPPSSIALGGSLGAVGGYIVLSGDNVSPGGSRYYGTDAGGTKGWHSLGAAAVGLGSVENTALSTWTGSANVTTLGTVTTGTWNASPLATAYIADDAVTNAKLANMAASTIKGRKTGSTGDPEDCTLSEILDFIGSAAQGDLLYRGASGWARLPAGTDGQVLETNGTGANPSWETRLSGTKTLATFRATDNEPPASNFATLDTRNSHPVLDFDTTTQEAAVFSAKIPQNTSLAAGVTVIVHWAATSATSGTVGWDVAFERIADGGIDIDSDSFGTAQTVTAATVPGTSGVTKVTSVTFTQAQLPASLAAGDVYRVRIRRDVTNDTATGDAELLFIEIQLQ